MLDRKRILRDSDESIFAEEIKIVCVRCIKKKAPDSF